ncbi:Pleiotropic drug resistance ABC transporter [Melia azedarach]|uniref:Pleiotropic drug resistance ABC transporter n=1 Tax=Melia azedarach TaxID=155640 RepID=A0ACC1Y4Y2_MELAZ|nr:Pleiotropic drug resistance ABC transporter [Melia azedarach]
MDMRGGDLYQLGNSLRANSSRLWRDTGSAAFSRSFSEDHQEDEEALKWAAMERLPTYIRLRTGLLAGEDGGASEIDVKKIPLKDRKILINRLLKDTEEDNGKFLTKLRGRLDRQELYSFLFGLCLFEKCFLANSSSFSNFLRVGIEIPVLELRFENLNVETEAYVGSRALPSFTKFFSNVIEGLVSSLGLVSSKKKHLHILHDMSGIVNPCRMTLLLGPPGSGKTTLLLALAGRLDPELKVTGSITYNGHKVDEFVPQRIAAYISQRDLHIPEMTVRETLAFSARCQGVGSRYEMLAELAKREKEENIKPDADMDVFMKAASTQTKETNVMADYIIKLLGLEYCADTMVGDDMLRGISGGQKKRVTTGEMMVGPSKVMLMDEISTGLDSSTTYQIVKSIKQYVQNLKGTALVSLLQPAPETYDLFDDIILLSDGQIVYEGPREHVLEFFESKGFKCPDRKGVADFLQEVTSKKDQQQYWARKDEPYSYITVKEFADSFRAFHVGVKLQTDLATPFDNAEGSKSLLTATKYGVQRKELLKACFAKEYLLMKRNSFVYIFKFCQLGVIALIGSTLFLRTEMHRDTINDGGIYMGALFFNVVNLMFNGMAELGMTIFKLPVFYKQRDLKFFPAWAYAVPTWILKIPVSLVEVLLYEIITYNLIGFDSSIERFFRQFFVLFLTSQMASGLFRLIASLGRDLTASNTFGSFALLVLFANCGFILSRDQVKKWWIWGYWLSPMMYAQNAVAVNEFLGDSWNKVIPNTMQTLGTAVLKSRGFFTDANWYWIGVGGLIGFTFFYNLGFSLALSFLKPFDKAQAIIEEDSDENVQTKEDSDPTKTGSEAADTGSPQKKRGMILPFDQHCVTFENVIYSVDIPKEMKDQGFTEERLVLLKGVTGTFRPGVLTALMGVSGAGKTTLMDVLAGRKTGGYIEGKITVSGYPKKQETFARVAGYCEQNDIHSPHVTVYESLLYSAWLRLPREVNAETRKMFIAAVMELVELNSLKGSIVGMPGVSGLSTEQRKRLTIAVELVANPSIIFMDEPTSGLDARAAAIVMRTVRNTVDTGRTVVCTIHQPSIDIFEAFDELLLLKRGGQEIYVGPLGYHTRDLINYFEAIEGVSKLKNGYNPATWMLEVSTQAQETALRIDFTDYYKKSDLYKRNKELIKQLSTPAPGTKDIHFATQYSQSFFTQCRACYWKQNLSYWRNPRYTAVRFFFTTVIALMFGTMFWNIGSKRDRQQDLFNSMGSMYSAVLFLGIQNANSVQPVVAIERTVFYREKATGMYSAFPYAFAQVFVEIPYIFKQAVVYGVIVYALMGFEWEVKKFFWYLFFMFFTLLYFTFYGMMTVAMTPNYHIAGIVAAAFYGIWNLFAGFMVPQKRMPGWWSWYYWICPIAWTLYGLVTSQYGDNKQMLDVGVSVKEFLKSYFGFEEDFLGVVAAVIVAFTVLFAAVFATAINVFNFQNR